MRSVAIVIGSIALATYTFGLAQADDVPRGVSRAHLASMGLAGMEPMSDAEGDEVRGNRAIFGGSGPFGIPLGPMSGSRLVVRLNWSYYELFPDLRTLILCHLLELGQAPESIPPGRREL
jgi:hypothetical protein